MVPNRRISKIHISKERILAAAERIIPVLVAVIVIAALLTCTKTASSSSVTAESVMTIKVQSGDTLWDYANKYGDPNEYILKRVHKIAEINKMKPGTPLMPGQEVKVPVPGNTMTAKAEE